MRKKRVFIYLVALFVLVCGLCAAGAWAQGKRPFTVADDIAVTQLELDEHPLQFSPDGKYLAVWGERGRLDLNSVEDSLRFYRTEDIEGFLKNSESKPPEPVWVARVTAHQHPAIGHWRWLPDSSGVAFQQWRLDSPRYQVAPPVSYPVLLADLRTKTIETLISAENERVQEWQFVVHDRQNYVYVVADHSEWKKKKEAEAQSGTVVGTGLGLWDLIYGSVNYGNDPVTILIAPSKARLWVVMDGNHFEVKKNESSPAFDGYRMALSPDGRWLATVAPVDEVPPSWEKLYPAPEFLSYGNEGIRPQHAIKAGHGTAKQYVRMDLKSGAVEPLVDAPTIDSLGIFTVGYLSPAWSSDGEEVLLPGTFLQPAQDDPVRPCVAIVDLRSKRSTCVVRLKEGYTKNTDPIDDFHPASDMITDAHFAPGDNRRVFVSFDSRYGDFGITRQYQEESDGSWRLAGETAGLAATGPGGLEVSVKATFKDPPLLTARNQHGSRVLLDPNPQLKEVQLADVSLYRWKDPEGREYRGGLYKPANYQPGKRYPLVIQTHGFAEREFAPSGLFPTAFAAQELAAAGIMVLQEDLPVEHGCKTDVPEEGPCEARVIESSVKQLVSEGLADPHEIGIIGFSSTCYTVMELLTTNLFTLKAASITDGIMSDYFVYLLFGGGDEQEKMMGGKPFGAGLQQWFKHSPEFNLDKVVTPLLVNTTGGNPGALTMLGPYSGLHALNKPVDFMIYNGWEHVATNPRVRMGSQGGSVDWFRFWLKGEEDPDPAKAEQYKRWHGLRELQAANEKERATHGAATP